MKHIVEGTFDDVLGVLVERDMKYEIERSRKIFERYSKEYESLMKKAIDLNDTYLEWSRKEIANELIIKRKETSLASLVFVLRDEKNPKPLIDKYLFEQYKTWEI